MHTHSKLTGMVAVFAIGLAVLLAASPAMAAAWGGDRLPGGGLFFSDQHFETSAGKKITQHVFIYQTENDTVTSAAWTETGGSGFVLIYANDQDTPYPVTWTMAFTEVNDTDFNIAITVPANAKDLTYTVYVWDATSGGCNALSGFTKVAAAGGVARLFTITVSSTTTENLITPLMWIMAGLVIIAIAAIWIAATRGNKWRNTWWDEAGGAILAVVGVSVTIFGFWNAFRILGYA